MIGRHIQQTGLYWGDAMTMQLTRCVVYVKYY